MAAARKSCLIVEDYQLVGLVTFKDVLRHTFTVIKEFGFKVWFTCLWSVLTRQNKTFLQCAFEQEIKDNK
jgi:hypothetical protein